MPTIEELQAETTDAGYLPPTFSLTFSQEEFATFLTNPTASLKDLGHPVKNLTVTVRDHVWDGGRREWVTDEPDKFFAANGGARAGAGAPVTLPASGTWEWWCGYEDEMCVCYRVLVP